MVWKGKTQTILPRIEIREVRSKSRVNNRKWNTVRKAVAEKSRGSAKLVAASWRTGGDCGAL